MPFRDFCRVLGGLGDLPDLRTVEPRCAMERSALEAFAELAFWSNSLVDAWELYLRVGGFPTAVADFVLSGDVSPAFVKDLWDVIRGEAIRKTNLGDGELLSLLARIIAGLCSPLNATSTAEDVGLGTHHAVNDRLGDLSFAFQTWKCYRRGDSGRPSTASQRKVYFVDPLIARIPSERMSGLPAPDAAKLSEQQLGLSLARAAADGRADRFVESREPMYERTSTSEIDFVGPMIGIPFESKYVERGWKRSTRPLAARHGRGIVATRDVLDTDGPIWAVPVSMLVCMLGV